MRKFIALFCICFVWQPDVTMAQEISGIEKKRVQALLDSADIYRLSDPSRCLQLALQVLSVIPANGNERSFILALIYASNSEKMLSRESQALNYADQAISIAYTVDDPELLMRSYYQKATIFGHANDNDSALVYYQKVINLHRPGLDPYFVSSAYNGVGEIYNTIGILEKAEEYLKKGYAMASGDEYSKIFALATIIGFYANNDNPKYLPYLDTLAMSDFYKNPSHESFMAHFDSFLRLDDATDEEKEKKLREVYLYSIKNHSLENQVGFGIKLYQHLDKMHHYEEAYKLLLELREKTLKTNNGLNLTGLTHALYNNSKSRGDSESALKYLEEYSLLQDSLLSVENTNRISELNIKFEAAQKDHEIEQQKIRIEQERRNRNFLILLAFLLSALAMVVFIFFRNRARQAQRIAQQENVIHRQETEKLLKEKEVAELTATLESQEKERNRIARDLHDGLGSMMSGISSQIEYLRTKPETDTTGHPHLIQLREMVKEATAELRRTSYELMPAKLLRQGLEPAIRDLCLNLLVKNGVDPTLEINADLTALNPEQQLTLYRIIQELFNNIVKHANARNVLIQFNHFDHEISVVVEDDGIGFDIPSKKIDGGLGLGSLQSRVNLLNGFLDIASIPGEGTTVTVNFSLTERENVRT